MSVPRVAKDLSEFQDVIGQLAYKIYTPICLCWPLPDASSQTQIIETLTRGLERLSISFPWLAGQVVSGGTAEGRIGRPQIVPLEKTSRLIVKDLTSDSTAPSMDALRKARFPFSMLDGKLLTSLRGAPTSYGESEDEPALVFFLQANFIRGGLVLSFAGEHSVMDGQGLGQIMRMLSGACHGEPFTAEEVLQGNRARNDIIPLLDASRYKPGPELDQLLVKPSSTTATPSPTLSEPVPECTWAYFHFSASSLSALKSQASPCAPTSTSSGVSGGRHTVAYISTDDAVSAFIWQSVSRIRHAMRGPTDAICTFARAVDARPSLSVPAFFPGNLSGHTYTSLTLSRVPSTPLSALASSLRLALDATELKYAMRSLATCLSVAADASGVRYGAAMDLSRDIFFSSWAKLPCYGLDFGLGLGLPESVRRPSFDTVQGLMYLMPMGRTGAIDAAICLADADLEGLKSDRGFVEFADWIG